MRKTSRRKRRPVRKAKRTRHRGGVRGRVRRGRRTRVGGAPGRGRKSFTRRLLPLFTAATAVGASAAGARPYESDVPRSWADDDRRLHGNDPRFGNDAEVVRWWREKDPYIQELQRVRDLHATEEDNTEFKGNLFTPHPGGYSCEDPGPAPATCTVGLRGSCKLASDTCRDPLREIEEAEHNAHVQAKRERQEVEPGSYKQMALDAREKLYVGNSAHRSTMLRHYMEEKGMTAQEARDKIVNDSDFWHSMSRAAGGIVAAGAATVLTKRAKEKAERLARRAAREAGKARVVNATPQLQLGPPQEEILYHEWEQDHDYRDRGPGPAAFFAEADEVPGGQRPTPVTDRLMRREVGEQQDTRP